MARQARERGRECNREKERERKGEMGCWRLEELEDEEERDQLLSALLVGVYFQLTQLAVRLLPSFLSFTLSLSRAASFPSASSIHALSSLFLLLFLSCYLAIWLLLTLSLPSLLTFFPHDFVSW